MLSVNLQMCYMKIRPQCMPSLWGPPFLKSQHISTLFSQHSVQILCDTFYYEVLLEEREQDRTSFITRLYYATDTKQS